MEKLKMHSPNLSAHNLQRLAELFPSCVVEARDPQSGALRPSIDFDQLRQELSGHVVEGPRERYHLDWPGKREAILAAHAPIAKTLRPCRDESLHFDSTKNLFIEGDNLDALKLLQETYLGKVKLIYIDPPYNTGNDFIYEDDFAQDVPSYLQRSNQTDASGRRLIANTEANGRFHSDWLTMMYSRIKASRYLLREDGFMMISIDDNELHNIKLICDEVFGEESFLATFVWQRRKMADSRNEDRASRDHEYVVCYKRPLARLKGNPIDRSKYSNPDNDPRGPWFSADLTGIANSQERPNLHFDLVNPRTGQVFPASSTRGWSCARATMDRLILEDRIIWPQKPDGRPRLKKFLNDATRLETGFSSWMANVGQTTEGTRSIQDIFGDKIFPFSKPLSLISCLVEQATGDGVGVVLDFFAGSATTAHAVMAANAFDGGTRQFIMVQVSEATGRTDYSNILDIAKERIRRAGRQLVAEHATTAPDLDVGFRVLKVDTSNMRDVYYLPDELRQGDLVAHADNIKEGRSGEDLLFQVLVDWGVDLSLPIGTEVIAGKRVFFVDGNALAACFETGIGDELVREVARRRPLRAVFRDSSHGSDSEKINVGEVFKVLSPTTEVRTV